jgi:hypothetical protein
MARCIKDAYTETYNRLKDIEGLSSTPPMPVGRETKYPALEMGATSAELANLTKARQPEGTYTIRFAIHVLVAQGMDKAREQLLAFPDRVITALMTGDGKLNSTVGGITGLSYSESKGEDNKTLSAGFELKVVI